MGCSDNIKFLAATALEFPSLNLLLDLTCCSQGRLGKVKILRHLPGGTVGRWDTATATGRIQTVDSCSALAQFTFKYLVLSDSDCGGGRGMFTNSQNQEKHDKGKKCVF